VEAGSNTSTVTLRVVGGDVTGSLKSETVKYGRKSQGTRTRERLLWHGPAAHTKDRPVLSSERAPHGIKNVTVRRIPYGNKNLVVSPGWVLYTKTVGRNIRLRLRFGSQLLSEVKRAQLKKSSFVLVVSFRRNLVSGT
jgi:hypothetical protein